MKGLVVSVVDVIQPLERRWLPVLLCLGVVLRLALAFPIFQFPAQADCVLAGMCAERVLNGDPPVFYAGFRNGSLPCFSMALSSLLVGSGRIALALGPVLVGTVLMVFWYLFVRTLLGWKVGLAALPFIAIPPPSVGFWLSMPNSYPETMALCAVILWLGVLTARRFHPVVLGLYGLSAGLGLWSSILTLGVSAPTSLWLFRRRPEIFRARHLAIAGVTCLVGMFPLLAFNLMYGWPSITNNFAARPTTGGAAVFSNLMYLVQVNLPSVAADLEPTHLAPSAIGRAAEIAVAGITLVAFVIFFALRRPPTEEDESGFDRQSWYGPAKWLFAGVVAAVSLFFVISEAGSIRGLTVRYVLPIAFLVPPVLASFLLRLRRWAPRGAVLLGAAILVFNLGALDLPGQVRRRGMAVEAEDYDRLLGIFAEAEVQLAVGTYWDAYPITYLTDGVVVGISVEVEHDHYQLVSRLPENIERWAVVSSNANLFARWLRVLDQPGVVVTSGKFNALISERDDWKSRQLLERLQTTLPRK